MQATATPPSSNPRAALESFGTPRFAEDMARLPNFSVQVRPREVEVIELDSGRRPSGGSGSVGAHVDYTVDPERPTCGSRGPAELTPGSVVPPATPTRSFSPITAPPSTKRKAEVGSVTGRKLPRLARINPLLAKGQQDKH